MNKLDEDTVAYVARLARVAISDHDIHLRTQELGQILHLVDVMQKVDTSGVVPTNQVTGLQDVWRADVVRTCSVSPAKLLEQAPRHQDGYIVVGRVLE